MEEKIFKNQTAVRIKRCVGQDITGALSLLLKHIKPDGTTGEWVGTQLGDGINGDIIRDVLDTETDFFDQAKDWIIWAWVKFSDGRTAPGVATILTIHEEGT
jgi:hypothetical protein